MLRHSFISWASLLCFGILTFQWEIQQVMMYQRMVQDRAEEMGWMAAADQALSGEAPCSGCMKLSRQKVADQDDEALATTQSPTEDMMSCESVLGLICRASCFSAYRPYTPSFQSRLLPPPMPPPV